MNKCEKKIEIEKEEANDIKESEDIENLTFLDGVLLTLKILQKIEVLMFIIHMLIKSQDQKITDLD